MYVFCELDWIHCIELNIYPKRWKIYLCRGTVERFTAEGFTVEGFTVEGFTVEGTVEGFTVEGSTVEGSTVEGFTVEGSTVEGSTVEGFTAKGFTAEGFTVEGFTVEGSTVVGSTVKGFTVEGSTVEGSTVEGFTVEGSTVEGSTVEGSTVGGFTVEGSTVEGSTVERSTVEGSTVEGSTVKGSTVEESTVEGFTVEGFTVEGSTFEGFTVEGSTVEGSTVEGSTIEGSTVERYTVEGSSVEGFTVEGSTVEGSTVEGVYSRGVYSRGFYRLTNCQDGWEENKGHCYKVFNERSTWHNASDKCEKLGGDLPSVPDGNTNRFIRNLTNNTNSVWIGLNDISIEKTYNWSDGSPYNFTNWSKGEPNSQDVKEDCVKMLSSGGWDDVDCHYLNHYICSLKKGLAKCQDSWEENSGYCYKVFNEGITWYNASDRCQKLEGYLPSIPDENTNRFIRNLILNRNNTDGVWIGLNDLLIEKMYNWSDGSPYKFTNWSNGQPNSNDKNEDCVEMYSSGRWNDVDCYFQMQYICSLKIVPNRPCKRKRAEAFNKKYFVTLLKGLIDDRVS
ncbi:C-type mannose receptor 2 [Bulinus truncatus]|nr:C-type mannose receptor 2 [Bulinus truncatus]